MASAHKGTALHFAAAERANVTVARVLVEEGGADKMARNGDGKTPLQLVVTRYGGRAHTPIEMITALT